LLPFIGKTEFLFAFPRGEVMEMEFTLEEVIGIITVIFIILTYINSIYKKK